MGGPYAYDKVRLSKKKGKDFDQSLKEDCAGNCFEGLLSNILQETDI